MPEFHNNMTIESPRFDLGSENSRRLTDIPSNEIEPGVEPLQERTWPKTWAHRLAAVEDEAVDAIVDTMNIQSGEINEKDKAILAYGKIKALIKEEYISG